MVKDLPSGAKLHGFMKHLTLTSTVKENFNVTHEVAKNEVARVLMSPDKTSALFPDGFVINWTPYPIRGRDTDPTDIDRLLDGKIVFSNDFTKSLSIAKKVISENSIFYHIQVYVKLSSGKIDTDHAQDLHTDDVIAHFLAHVQYISEWQTDRNISFDIVFNDGIDRELVQEKCRRLGFTPEKMSLWFIVVCRCINYYLRQSEEICIQNDNMKYHICHD